MRGSVRTCVRVAIAGLLAAVVGHGLAAAQAAPAASVARAKELAGLMASRKLDAFAVRESAISDRFIAVMMVPDVQMLVVSANYGRPTDMEYFIYQKDYVSAYRDLQGSALAKDRLFVDDVLCDGLVAVPAKNSLPDAVTIDAAKQLFSGPADPKKRNDTRTPADAYGKAFADADQRYVRMLDNLIAELKKPGILVPAGLLR